VKFGKCRAVVRHKKKGGNNMSDNLEKEMKALRSKSSKTENSDDGDWVFVPFIRRNGKIIYPKNAKFFRFKRYYPKKPKTV
jgi:ribosomal silencing factor RsfS